MLVNREELQAYDNVSLAVRNNECSYSYSKLRYRGSVRVTTHSRPILVHVRICGLSVFSQNMSRIRRLSYPRRNCRIHVVSAGIFGIFLQIGLDAPITWTSHVDVAWKVNGLISGT